MYISKLIPQHKRLFIDSTKEPSNISSKSIKIAMKGGIGKNKSDLASAAGTSRVGENNEASHEQNRVQGPLNNRSAMSIMEGQPGNQSKSSIRRPAITSIHRNFLKEMNQRDSNHTKGFEVSLIIIPGIHPWSEGETDERRETPVAGSDPS